jgi:phosphate transport system permease protein
MSVMESAEQPVVVAPERPWAKKPQEVRGAVLKFVAAAIAAAVVVLLTGMAGVDGWATALLAIVLVATSVGARKLTKKDRKNALVSVGIGALALLAFAPWLSILFSVVTKGWQALHWTYLFNDMRVTTPDDELNMGGVGHAVVGSLIMVAIATVVTLPLGILSGIYLTEVRGRLTFLVRFIVQSMAGVPSIVAGLFIFTTVVRTMGEYSGIAGAAALSVLMLPTVSRTAEEVLKLVPDDLRNAGYALGARQWRTAFMVVLPTVKSGLITAGILGVARVIGETAPLLLTSLATNGFAFNPFGGTLGSLPTYTFSLLQYGTDYAVARAWSGALVLMLIVFGLFTVARRVGRNK